MKNCINLKDLRRQLRERTDREKTRGVYALVDPETAAVRYIGMSDHIERRYMEHVVFANRERTLGKRHWVVGLLVRGLVPGLQILEAIPAGDMAGAEREWIRAYELVGQADMNWFETTRRGKKTVHP